ncbi:MAG: hypothetical protein EXR86_14750 [Gammaproteobacteria bacterium]|nr:hypothetical protein [Gammaproteobacteria bacterium]
MGLALMLFAFLPVIIKLIKEIADKIKIFYRTIPNFFMETVPEFFSDKFGKIKDFALDFVGDILGALSSA